MYSGNHSPCHPLITLLEAAERLNQHRDVVFCFVGGGSEFPRLKEYVRQKKMANVICLPYQPIEELSASLSAADLHVVIMGDQYVGIVHPSKIYNILAVGCDFLYIGPVESHVGDIIERVGEFGVEAYAARHGDIDGVADAILTARNKPRSITNRSSNPKEYFSKGALISEMIRVIE
jgi:colanic acid biosynthesis glycosyl transferase WcaI